MKHCSKKKKLQPNDSLTVRLMLLDHETNSAMAACTGTIPYFLYKDDGALIFFIKTMAITV